MHSCWNTVDHWCVKMLSAAKYEGILAHIIAECNSVWNVMNEHTVYDTAIYSSSTSRCAHDADKALCVIVCLNPAAARFSDRSKYTLLSVVFLCFLQRANSVTVVSVCTCSGSNVWKPWPRNFIFAAWLSEYLGRVVISRSLGQDPGHSSKRSWLNTFANGLLSVQLERPVLLTCVSCPVQMSMAVLTLLPGLLACTWLRFIKLACFGVNFCVFVIGLVN